MVFGMACFQRADRDVEKVDECCKLLIDAGSDLSSIQNDESSSGYSWEVSALSAALEDGSLVSFLS